MHAIDTQDGLFHDGDGVSELGTVVTAAWLNQIQAELLAVLQEAGIKPETLKYNQVIEAIKLIINKNQSAMADRLTNKRKIGGIDFDGTNDIHLPISGRYISTEKYEAGDLVKVDGEWYECYHPDGCKGKDPRDPVNRPAGWQNTDQSQPYFWLKIGRWLSFPESGSPIYLPATVIREGLIKYRNDGNLHKDKFWRLAELYPNLISNNLINIADLRGEFLRGFDDGRGVDSNRKINSWQRHQIINHVHGIQGWTGDSSMLVARNGSLNKLGGVSVTKGDGGIIYSDKTGFQVDPSWRMISTDNISSRAEEVGAEARPRNVAMLIATRI